jgi:hypothetical protein
VKGYLEYLELYAYFARPGETKLSRAEYESLNAEFRGIAARYPKLSSEERARLGELKLVLYRDKP